MFARPPKEPVSWVFDQAFAFFFLRMTVLYAIVVSGAEQERDAPNACESNHGINDAAENGQLAAEQKGNAVKTEQTDTAPVQRTDDRQQQCYSVNHTFPSLDVRTHTDARQ